MHILRDSHPRRPVSLSWPRTRFGVLSAWLGILGLLLVVANSVTPSDGSQSGLVQAEVILMILVAPAAVITAVIAAFRDHERSVFTWVPIAIAAALLTLTLFELTFPRA